MATKQELLKNFKECIEGGLSEEAAKRYRNAVELYYKAVVALCDIIILDKEGEVPDYHKKRDEMLGQLNGDVNKIRIGLHALYRQSYYKSAFTPQELKELKQQNSTDSMIGGRVEFCVLKNHTLHWWNSEYQKPLAVVQSNQTCHPSRIGGF